MTATSFCLRVSSPALIVNHNTNKSNKKTAPTVLQAIGALLLFYAKNNIDYALALSFVTRADFFLAALFL